MKKFCPYSIIFQDDEIAVFSKNSQVLVAEDRYEKSLPRLDLIAQEECGKLLAVHRIDSDCSGLVVYAKKPESQQNLLNQFEKGRVETIYHGIIYGRPSWQNLEIDVPVLTDSDERHRSTVNKRYGKKAITNFEDLGHCGQFSWLKASTTTDRANQIRVHLAQEKLSFVCDPLYGGNTKPIKLSEIKKRYNGDTLTERPLLARLALHAYQISFEHPKTHQTLQFTAPYLRDMESVRNQFEKLYGVNPLKKGE